MCKAETRVAKITRRLGTRRKSRPLPIPNQPLPAIGTLGFRVQRYGVLQWGDLFTARQKAALVVLVEALRGIESADATSLIGSLVAIEVHGVVERKLPLGTCGGMSKKDFQHAGDSNSVGICGKCCDF